MADYHNSIIAKYSTDGNGNIAPKLISNENITVLFNGVALLDEIPYRPYGVYISGYTEVSSGTSLSATQFYVEYTGAGSGKIHFAISEVGKHLEVTYEGIGKEVIVASRIATEWTEDGDIVQTLATYINNYASVMEANRIHSAFIKFTATVQTNQILFADIPTLAWNPAFDTLEVVKDGVILIKDENFSVGDLGITLYETLDIGESIYFRVFRGLLVDLPAPSSDGSLILNGTVGQLKLSPELQGKINTIATNTSAIGTLANLTSTDKTNLVNAINENKTTAATAVSTLGTTIDGKIGTLSNLGTTAKDNVVNAINEHNNELNDIATYARNHNTLQLAIDNTPANGVLQLKHNETYTLDTALNITNNIEIDGNGSTLNFSSADGILGTGTLKSTKTVSGNYVSGQYCITLNDATGIAVGDLLNVVSSELFDTARTYYFKGGNVLVTKVSGNVVTMSRAFPFNMTAASITVKVYTPITVKIKNINVIGTASISTTEGVGVKISYGKDCVFSKIKTDNFRKNIVANRLVNSKYEFITPKHAKNLSGDSWDGYGISIFSCSDITVKNSNLKSGQHGLTWGGEEVNYGIVLDSCYLNSEVDQYGLGEHENIHDVHVVNCKIYGLSLAGNALVENCDIFANEENTANKNILMPAETTSRANYIFKNCRFNGMYIVTVDYYQQVCPTRKYIGSIAFENCKDFTLIANINNQSAGVKVGEVSDISFKDCTNAKVSIYDNINNISIQNTRFTGEGNLIEQPIMSTQGKIQNMSLKNCTLDKSYNTIFISNAGKITLDDVKLSSTDYGSSSFEFNSVENLIILNSDLSGFTRGCALTSIGRLTLDNSQIRFYNQTTSFTNCTKVFGKNWTNYVDGYLYDIFTTQTNGKKKTYINDSNALVVGSLY